MWQQSTNPDIFPSFNFVTFEMLLVALQPMSDKQTQFPLKYSTMEEPRVISSLLPLEQNGSNFRALICLSPSVSLLFLCLLRAAAKPTPITLQRVGVQLYQKRCDERGGSGSPGVQCCDQSEITKS